MSEKNSLYIVKIGGNSIDDPVVLDAFFKDFSRMNTPKILVHGGGKEATRIAEKMKIAVRIVDGRRITDKKNIDLIVMTYAGLINKRMVAGLQKMNCNALGLCGADADTIRTHKRDTATIDYGFVGDIDFVNTKTIAHMLQQDIVPVFCAVTHDKKGQLLNTNADTIASEIAIALSGIYHTKLIYCFEKKGVLKDITDENSVIDRIDLAGFQQLNEKRVIREGMIPKIDNCFNALKNGVNEVVIGNTAVIGNENAPCTRFEL